MVQAPKHNIFNLHVFIVSAVSVEWIIVIGGDVVPRQIERIDEEEGERVKSN